MRGLAMKMIETKIQERVFSLLVVLVRMIVKGVGSEKGMTGHAYSTAFLSRKVMSILRQNKTRERNMQSREARNDEEKNRR